ncbi:MAG: ATP-binding cassette domain-containing protein, partial [Candidatus Thermoplasmatota archaeon]|nr:ATP-binding cassette domain-containing protein [Candidatus Thermoplasmatota archaeon]
MFELKGGSKRYGDVVLFHGLDFAVKKGEIVSILGPSGCGKTTLLRTMCGLESLDQGTRLLNGASLVNGELHPGITMLFQ